MTDEIYPAPIQFSDAQLTTDPILRYFHYAHLPPALQTVSKRFCELADFTVRHLPRNTERSVALRKLLEAKDAAVRANVETVAARKETFYDRLLAESKELEGRIEKLGNFIASTTFTDLDTQNQNMMRLQHEYMRHYADTLGWRIAANKPFADAGLVHIEDGEVKITGGH